MFNFKKRSFYKKNYMNTIPLILVSKRFNHFSTKKQGKTFNNFFNKKIISNKQIHKG